VTSPDGHIRIPINEPSSGGTATEQFIHDYFGEGIQHIALRADDLAAAVDEAVGRGVEFLPIPDRYYDDLRKAGRLAPALIERLQDRNMMIDFDETGGLLQAYTKPVAGTIFFELLERRDHTGFGHRNASTRLSALQALRAAL
jgi:4-hydroxyphenylpyruvate dioxygenase